MTPSFLTWEVFWLIGTEPIYINKKIFSDEEEMDYFLSNICTSEWNAKQDGERSIAEATEILVAELKAIGINI